MKKGDSHARRFFSYLALARGRTASKNLRITRVACRESGNMALHRRSASIGLHGSVHKHPNILVRFASA